MDRRYFFFTLSPIAKSTIIGANRSAGIGHNTVLNSFLILSPAQYQPRASWPNRQMRPPNHQSQFAFIPLFGFRSFKEQHPFQTWLSADQIHAMHHTKSVMCVTH